MDSQKIIRIGVFYDGNFFLHISNYYNYIHPKKRRISISGLHEFIRSKVADLEGGDFGFKHCQIVDAHYFRSRMTAGEASQKGNQLYYDRVFDDILMSEGVTTHYIPTKQHGKSDKGIDLLLALEAYEQTFYKRFDVLVLIASDGNYAPLIRKINTLGTRVLVLGWNLEYNDDYGQKRVTRTSQDLLNLATYPIEMHKEIDQHQGDSFFIDQLFVSKELREEDSTERAEFEIEEKEGQIKSTIFSLKSGYGFIKYPPNNLFFHFESVIGTPFSDLQPGDPVRFEIMENEKGEQVAQNVKLAESDEEDLPFDESEYYTD